MQVDEINLMHDMMRAGFPVADAAAALLGGPVTPLPLFSRGEDEWYGRMPEWWGPWGAAGGAPAAPSMMDVGYFTDVNAYPAGVVTAS